MADGLFWLYLTNAVLLITHEIDSAYWKEWELFELPGGVTGFLLLHIPLLLFILYGLTLVSAHSRWGLVFSLALSLGGLFAFSIHSYFLRKGREEFNQPVSKYMLKAILLVSVVQLAATLYTLLI